MNELRQIAKRLEVLAGIARGNARAAKIAGDDDAWRAHAEDLDRAVAGIREHISEVRGGDRG